MLGARTDKKDEIRRRDGAAAWRKPAQAKRRVGTSDFHYGVAMAPSPEESEVVRKVAPQRSEAPNPEEPEAAHMGPGRVVPDRVHESAQSRRTAAGQRLRWAEAVPEVTSTVRRPRILEVAKAIRHIQERTGRLVLRIDENPEIHLGCRQDENVQRPVERPNGQNVGPDWRMYVQCDADGCVHLRDLQVPRTVWYENEDLRGWTYCVELSLVYGTAGQKTIGPPWMD